MDKSKIDSSVENKPKLRIHLDFGDNSLYDLGYLSIDIYQLIVFSRLIEDNDRHSLEKYFYGSRRSFMLTRNSSILKKYRNSANVEHMEDGSIVIDIAQVGLVATIIVPFVAMYVQEQIKKYSEEVTFEINSQDKQLQKIIEEVGQGYFGLEDEGLKWLLNMLENRGYSIEVINKDVYRINKVMTNYQRRIVRTIKKYIK
ncbi:hypothetical protein CLRAG_29410 [Clostridium ragsdalei P11]|uniref:Uncharacterized protein n=1 Tax=Clostridium ragsdalei P11 TaxID=1353534 RepID=A0A1A6AND2_9CLOT|nr:hypothetical protein [Clostridium ragsdalei]OBR91577.1 hypothetical protein CLRAG_29410 [Clostridium ragsdalei P11]